MGEVKKPARAPTPACWPGLPKHLGIVPVNTQKHTPHAPYYQVQLNTANDFQTTCSALHLCLPHASKRLFPCRELRSNVSVKP